MDDLELLGRYAQEQDQQAFAELVRPAWRLGLCGSAAAGGGWACGGGCDAGGVCAACAAGGAAGGVWVSGRVAVSGR